MLEAGRVREVPTAVLTSGARVQKQGGGPHERREEGGAHI